MSMKAIFACCFPAADEKTNVDVKTNQIDLKESIFSEEKILDKSTRNENGTSKEKKDKATFEDQHRPKESEYSPFLQNEISSSPFKSKLFIDIPQSSNSKEKLITTPTFSSDVKLNHLKSLVSPSSNVNEETFSDYLVNQTITSQVQKETPDMLLEELEGEQLNGKKLIINAAGLENSPRKARDGFVFFGTNIEDSAHRIINDFKLKMDLKNKDDINSEHIFVLFFSLSRKKYFIRSYHNHLMNYLLIKLDSKYRIHNNEYIMLADMFFLLTIDASQTLTIKKYATKRSPEESEHHFPQGSGIITIGRDKNCSVSFPHQKQFSKVHTSFHYENSSWFIADGGERPSTIGTWIMPKHSYQINEGTMFKIPGNSKFKLSFLYK